MIFSVLKDIGFVSACVLLWMPSFLAVLNFERRTETKRRALTNLLSDPRILSQYKDRFPSTKGLTDAQSIAKVYFETYFNRSEYGTALAFNFLTCSLALMFVLVELGFPPPFVHDRAVQYIQQASWGGTARWALIGSYLWNCYDLIRQSACFNLRPDVMTKMWLKLWVAAAVAAIFSAGVTDGLQPAVGFAIGLVSIPALFAAVSDKSSKVLNRGTPEGDTSTQIRILQGATGDLIDALDDIDIESTVHLAYCDPIHVMMSTNLPWVVIIDLVDQALLFNYIGADISKIRSGGYRGCIEVATIGAHLNGSPAEQIVGTKSLGNLALLLGWTEDKALDLVQTLYIDSQVNLIWNLFGGNYMGRDRETLPVKKG